MSTGPGKIALVSAELLTTDPVTAARRLLGARLLGRGVSAVIVEVEAYGGPPDGPWPDAASHSYRGPRPRNTVMFGPAGRMYTYRSHGIHVCANVVSGYDGVHRGGADSRGGRRRRPRRGPALAAAPRCAAWHSRVAREICALHWESRWTTTESTCSIAESPVRLELGAPTRWRQRPARRGEPGRRSAVAVLARGHPEVSAYRRSPGHPRRATATDTGRSRP